MLGYNNGAHYCTGRLAELDMLAYSVILLFLVD